MEEIASTPFTILTALLCLLSITLWYINTIFLHPSNNKNLPPSPSKLPIIGNLHQLGSLPHQNLHSLAQKHGPLMLLHLGRIPCLIVSSADAAREVMKTHDLIFASRPAYNGYSKLLYDGKDVASAPYGKYWRQMRGVFVTHLLSKKKVQDFRPIWEEETAILVEKIEKSGGAVNLSGLLAELANDGMCRVAFGWKCNESENGKRFLMLMTDFMEMMLKINVGDLIPWLSWVGRVSGTDKKISRIFREVDQILEGVIREREMVKEFVGNSSVDIILEICNANNVDLSIDRDSIKPLILDVFVGGTDTIFTALEWTMTELLRHPRVMKELQCELTGIVKEKHDITDEDLGKMHYLKAVIKETLRVHPPIPLILPRLAREDAQINGYHISAGTVVIVNAWSIGKDSNSWDNPMEFMPERFLNSSIDYKGLDFEFIPFGSGRRGCPGITFAIAAIEFVLANILHKFDWKLLQEKELDMNETPGITARRAVPLFVVASPTI